MMMIVVALQILQSLEPLALFNEPVDSVDSFRKLLEELISDKTVSSSTQVPHS